LHKGRFTLPEMTAGTAAIQLSSTELLSMLAGLHLHRSKKRT
jgi:hypothetical protein